MGAQEMSTLLDGLVAEARSSRDRAVNAIDAGQRESRRNNARVAGQVDRYMRVHETALAEILRREVPRLRDLEAQPDPAAARDARFDPEDEWEVSGPPPGKHQAPPPGPRQVADDDDDDDYPATWLR